MQKKKCYLCGGNLVNGVCVDCGLDNTRNDKKSYRLNCTSAEFAKDGKKDENVNSTLMEEQQKSYQQTASQKTKQKSKYRMEQKTEQKAVQRRDANKRVRRNAKATVEGKKLSASKIVKIIIIAVIILNILPFIIETGTEVIHKLTLYYTTKSEQEQLKLEQEQAYYQNARYELSNEGKEFEIELTQGIYKIGTHIPEGMYSLERIEGSGFCKMVDNANGIYTHWWFSEYKESEKEGAVQFVEDAHLYQDGYLKIEGSVKIRFTSTCAQIEKMNSTVENPLLEKVYLNEGEEYIAGEDFPAGIYDLTTEADWIGVKLNYDDISDGYWVSSGNQNDGVFRNIYVPEGTSVSVENGIANFAPSKQIEPGSYDSYYINSGM